MDFIKIMGKRGEPKDKILKKGMKPQQKRVWQEYQNKTSSYKKKERKRSGNKKKYCSLPNTHT